MTRWEAGVKSNVRPVLGCEWIEMGKGLKQSFKSGVTKPHADIFCGNLEQNNMSIQIN